MISKDAGKKIVAVLSSIFRLVEMLFFMGSHLLLFLSLLLTLKLRIRRQRETLNSLAGKSLARLFESLGPTFIKFGQILSSRPDLLPPDMVAELSRLQDRIPPFGPRAVASQIKEAFGKAIDEIFESFDLTPVSSASIAQVHRARLRNGLEVAVKVRRPGIVRKVENDLRLFSFTARMLGALPFMRTVPLADLVEEIGNPIHQQLDFKLEAQNNREFRRNFAEVEHIRIPALIDDLCGEGALTMEFLEDLSKVNSPRFTVEERKVSALAGLRALYKMIFTDGFIHADMHPGNVFVRRWGEFVILDTGLVAQLSPADREDFVNFFFGLVNNQGKECARIIFDTASYRAARFNRAGFDEAMAKLIAKHSRLRSSEFEIARFVYELIETQQRFGLRGSTKFMMTVISMVVFDGICKQLYPDCDFQAEARGFLIYARYNGKSARNSTGLSIEPASILGGLGLQTESGV